MTQPPLPPQMPPESLDELPLNEQERALARALRNLPVGAPPPELDARILGAARRAVHLAPPRKNNQRRWLIGLGTAASALLAVGLFVKTHGPGEGAVFAPSDTARPAANAPSASMTSTSANAPTSATQAARASDQAAPAPADMIAPAGDATSAQSITAAKSVPKAFPNPANAPAPESAMVPPIEPPPPPPPRMQSAPASAPPVIVEEAAPMSVSPPPAPPAPPMRAVDERKTEQDFAARRDAAAIATPAPAPPPSPATAGAALDQPALDKPVSSALKSNAAASGSINAAKASKDLAFDRIEVTGSAAGAVLPPIDDDATLAPAQWIERIRARVKAADGAGARESLRRFSARYPDANIPDDLLPLLR